MLGVSSTLLGHPDLGETTLRRAVELRERLDYPDSVWLVETPIGLADALLTEG